MKKSLLSILVAMMAIEGIASSGILPLAGSWRFELDRADAGLAERWFDRTLPDSVRLPGDLTGQGIGEPVTVETSWIGGIVDRSWFTDSEYAAYREPGNVKVPFWLQPELYYAGAAWYQRDLEIPAGWQGRRIVLFLERPHWETRVWIDGRAFGINNALATPHEFDLGQLASGRHTLTIRVDNRMIVDVGENSHSVSDHTQGNWNGIVGRLELRATPLAWIDAVRVFPEAARRRATIRVQIGNAAGKPGQGWLELLADPGTAGGLPVKARRPVAWEATGGEVELELELGPAAPLWDEFNPAVYELTVALAADGAPADTHRTRFGLRTVAARGTQFVINGRPTFFRGTLECAIFPKTGHPPTGVEEWRRIIRACQAHGLNHIRFHSWCPPEAAFLAADELGFYFQVEASSWANQSTTLGDGKPVDRWVFEETERILRHYGNHPSFVLMASGNEPGGPRQREYLAHWLEHFRALDGRRLYTGGSGWPELPENQFHVLPDPRVQAWGSGLRSRINARPPETMTDYRDFIRRRAVPVISHEIGQWCVHPNFDEMTKYTGYLKPRNFEIFRDRLEANGMGHLARSFLLASGALQVLCYKEDIESALRTPGMGGFQLLDLHDFPGQGTALVGVLDPFWEEKGYITPAAFRRFSNTTVPLARLPRRIFTTDDTLTASIEVAHLGPAPLADAVVEWRLVDSSAAILQHGEFPPLRIPVDNPVPVGHLHLPLQDLPAPAEVRLIVRVRGTPFENDWDLWIYPGQPVAEPAEVRVTARFDEETREYLGRGGRVLLSLPGRQVRNFIDNPVKTGFSSIFWNTAWTGRQAPTTLGILCDPRHPALAHFPTDPHSNWQWWYLMHRAGALRLDLLPPDTQPIVRIIDDWFTARPLGLVVEGRVGPGRIVVCGLDLTGTPQDPVSTQMRTSLTHYLASPNCQPATDFTFEQIHSLIAEQAGGPPGVRAVRASSEQAGFEAVNAVDGDPETLWHTAWGDGAPAFPHELIVEFDPPRIVAGIAALPRQDNNRNGWIRDYEVWGSPDGQNWGTPLARGRFPADAALQTVRFTQPATVRFLKLRALTGHATGPWASLAGLNVIAGEN